jgi:hypothetical protein
MTSDCAPPQVRICAALRVDFAIPTALDFLYCLLQRLHWPSSRMYAVHRGQHKEAGMLAQFLCEVALLSADCAAARASVLACCSLCLALACLRCGLWRDGSPGPSSSPEQYWTASMVQATGYSRVHLLETLRTLQRAHEDAFAELRAQRVPGAAPADGAATSRYDMLRKKFSAPRFLDVQQSPPFAPHTGGGLYRSMEDRPRHLSRSPLVKQASTPPA